MEELTAALVNEAVPKLIEVKKRLTVDGKLDDALAVRALIEKLQGDYMKMARPEPTSLVTADALVQAYSADRIRAPRILDSRFLLDGVVAQRAI